MRGPFWLASRGRMVSVGAIFIESQRTVEAAFRFLMSIGPIFSAKAPLSSDSLLMTDGDTFSGREVVRELKPANGIVLLHHG